MKIYLYSVIISFCLFACNEAITVPTVPESITSVDSVVVDQIQTIINAEKLIGSVLIFDQTENTYFSNDFDWSKKGQLPASTFKIPNSIIALELGIIEDSSTILPWDGEPKTNSNWEKDLKAKDAFQLSCVPCYREIARQVGLNKMISYIKAFNYGNMVVDSANLDLFWLMGASKISPFEQIRFLVDFNDRHLNINTSTYSTMKYMLLRENSPDYQLFGKTGWSTEHERDNTWFVGFFVTSNKVYYFATNLEPTSESDMHSLAFNRIGITKQALEQITNIKFHY